MSSSATNPAPLTSGTITQPTASSGSIVGGRRDYDDVAKTPNTPTISLEKTTSMEETTNNNVGGGEGEVEGRRQNRNGTQSSAKSQNGSHIKQQQHQQQQQQGRNKSSSSSNGRRNNATPPAAVTSLAATQNRSGRKQPSSSNNNTNNNNNGGKSVRNENVSRSGSFKDMRPSRLIERSNSVSGRPSQPPPPPPPTSKATGSSKAEELKKEEKKSREGMPQKTDTPAALATATTTTTTAELATTMMTASAPTSAANPSTTTSATATKTTPAKGEKMEEAKRSISEARGATTNGGGGGGGPLNGLDRQPQKQQQQQQQQPKMAVKQKPNEDKEKDVNEKEKEKEKAVVIHAKEQQQQQQQQLPPRPLAPERQVKKGRETATTTATPVSSTSTRKTSASSSTFIASSEDHHHQQRGATNGSGKHPQRTVVRVAPFNAANTNNNSNSSNNKNSSTQEVHRLKISHTDEDSFSSSTTTISNTATSSGENHRGQQQFFYASNGQTSQTTPPTPTTQIATHNSSYDASWSQRKTSILITGDDCYSTMNLSCDDAATPFYQSSVVVAGVGMSPVPGDDVTSSQMEGEQINSRVFNSSRCNTVTINVTSPRSADEALIEHNNKLNALLSRRPGGLRRTAIIPIRSGTGSSATTTTAADVNLQRSASSTSSTSTSSMTSISSCGSGSAGSGGGAVDSLSHKSPRGRTLIRLEGYHHQHQHQNDEEQPPEKNAVAENNIMPPRPPSDNAASDGKAMPSKDSPSSTRSRPRPTKLCEHEEELRKILRNPVEAVKRNLVPHVCGRDEKATPTQRGSRRNNNVDAKEKDKDKDEDEHEDEHEDEERTPTKQESSTAIDDFHLESPEATLLRRGNHAARATLGGPGSFIATLLEDPMLGQVADGLETDTVAELIENSLLRLQTSRGGNGSDEMGRLISLSLQKIKQERKQASNINNGQPQQQQQHLGIPSITEEDHSHSNRGSISSATSFASASNYEAFEFDAANESDCYQSCSSEITSDADAESGLTTVAATRSKFYQMLVDATLAEIEMTTSLEDEEEDDDDEVENDIIRDRNTYEDDIDDEDFDDDDDDDLDHHYESIRNGHATSPKGRNITSIGRLHADPIYEEIGDLKPPPLPQSAPPIRTEDIEDEDDALQEGLTSGGSGRELSKGVNATRSIFEGASKYDILSYLVEAKERGVVRDEGGVGIGGGNTPNNYDVHHHTPPIIIEEEATDTLSDLDSQHGYGRTRRKDIYSRASLRSSSDDDGQCSSSMSSLSPPPHTFLCSGPVGMMEGTGRRSTCSDIERNDSGVGSETSKSSRSKYLLHGCGMPRLANGDFVATSTSNSNSTIPTTNCGSGSSGLGVGVGGKHITTTIHLCEDCDSAVEMQRTAAAAALENDILGSNGRGTSPISNDGSSIGGSLIGGTLLYAPLVCRKCSKKRVERKEIITEIVETEEKYGRDLQIILEEFYHPMLVAGLLTQEQLSAIFLNTEELLENNQTLAERMRDALDIALEQGDDDLLTVNVGRIFLDFTQMLHAFERYCVRQAGASLLLANLEKEKELLRIFLKVSQMENAVLRRMNLNSFLMVPVQRVTKYPLLLARLYKVTPTHLEGRDQLREAQEKIELHLNHINQEAKDVPTKLWRRISSSSPNRRASCEVDMINIKLRKLAIDILEWNHDEVRFVLEGKLLYTQPTDNNWKKARTIKLTPANALLVTNGKTNGSPSSATANFKTKDGIFAAEKLSFPKQAGVREATLLVVKEKGGRYTLLREPLYLDRCIVCSDADWDDYFEVQEIATKDTFIFKAEDGVRTKQWYTQLQLHAQGMGAWRKRRNALANIMINGMTRN